MRRTLIASALLLSTTVPACAEEAAKAAPASTAPVVTGAAKAAPAKASGAAPATESAKTLYAIGLVLSQNLGPLKLTAAELASVKEGLTDGVLGRPPKVELATYGPKLQEFAKGRLGASAAGEKSAGAAFCARSSARKNTRTRNPQIPPATTAMAIGQASTETMRLMIKLPMRIRNRAIPIRTYPKKVDVMGAK